MLTIDPMEYTLQAPDAAHPIQVKCPAHPWFALTWPRFRYAEHDIGGRWVPVAANSDEDLAERGFCLASQIRYAGDLSATDQLELAQLLARSNEKLPPEDQARLSTLLECCPFMENAPPLDIDPQAPDVTPEELEQVSERITASWINMGLGPVRWYSTGGRGLHGHFQVPANLASPHLMRAYGVLVRQAANSAQLPLLSQHRERANRPRILVDDTLFDRDASGRGGLWRLAGAKHTKTGRRKRPVKFAIVDAKLDHDAIFEVVTRIENEFAEKGRPVRKKPRSLHELQGMPTPHPQLLGKGALKHTSDLIAECARRGANHDFRKALAGWLLREGVPTTVATATISAAGDPVDAAGVVRTTADRMTSGRNTFGFRKLAQLCGTMGATEFQAVLTLDLEEAQVEPRDLSRFLAPHERETLKEAGVIAEKAGNSTRALTCRRASRCGIASQYGACHTCGDAGHSWCMVAERPTCPHCANRRSRAIINWCIRRWPEAVQCLTMRLPDTSLAFARKARQHWSRKVPAKYKGTIRWLIAPGWLVAITANGPTGYWFHNYWPKQGWTSHIRKGKRHPQMLGHLALLKVLRPALDARAAHLRRYLRLGDAQGLADDAWLEKVMETSGGKHARKHLPWPKPRDIRLDAINDRRVKNNEEPLAPGEPIPTLADRIHDRSDCCQGRIDYTIVDTASKATIGIRNDRPWTFGEASVRAENGWRGEKLEFDEHGRLLRTILPPGYDIQRLIE